MLKATINKKQYQICDNWEDLTLDIFIQLAEIQIPKKLESSWVASSKLSTDDKKQLVIAEAEYKKAQSKINEDDLINVFPEYYGKVILLLSDIPVSVMDNINSLERTNFFENHLRQFALSMIYSMPVISNDGVIEIYEPVDVKSFKIGKEIFYFPKSMKLYNEVIPMSEEKIVSFAEAADIDLAIRGLQSEGIQRLPVFMGIYCRKLNENYSEKKALERVETFKKARMSEVWSVFFYIAVRTQISLSYIQTYFHQRAEVMQTLRKAA